MSPKQQLPPLHCNTNLRRLRGTAREPTYQGRGDKTLKHSTEENEETSHNVLFYPKILQNTTEIDLLTYLGHCDLL